MPPVTGLWISRRNKSDTRAREWAGNVCVSLVIVYRKYLLTVKTSALLLPFITRFRTSGRRSFNLAAAFAPLQHRTETQVAGCRHSRGNESLGQTAREEARRDMQLNA